MDIDIQQMRSISNVRGTVVRDSLVMEKKKARYPLLDRFIGHDFFLGGQVINPPQKDWLMLHC